MVCNKSDRDRTGWDFVVEFPMPGLTPGQRFEDREPTACSVQLKSTTLAGPVKTSLSAIERLAKDPRPSFLVVFRLTPAGEGRHGYLIPMLGPPLARVLRRLRLAQVQNRTDLNRIGVTFDYRKLGTRFALTPDGLVTALSEACGPDPAAYVRTKQHQREALGYEDGRYEAEATVWVEGTEDLNDMMLGLTPLKAEAFTVYDVRFGLRLPYEGDAFDTLEDLRIMPPSMGTCTVAMRGAGLSPAAVFDAEMFVGPPQATETGLLLLIRHSEFTIKFNEVGLTFSAARNFTGQARSLQEWITLLRALVHLASGRGEIALTMARGDGLHLRLPISEGLDGPHLEQLPAALDILVGWNAILDLAGVPASSPFNWTDLARTRTAALAATLFGSHKAEAWFAFNPEALGGPEGAVEAIYINTACLGGASVSFAVKVLLEPVGDGEEEYRSTQFTALDARPAVADLDDYAAEIAEAYRVHVIIHPANVIEANPEDAPMGNLALADPGSAQT
jgi:hypothetical protein